MPGRPGASLKAGNHRDGSRPSRSGPLVDDGHPDKDLDLTSDRHACRRVLVFNEHFPPGHLAGGALKSVSLLVDTAPAGWAVDVITSDRDLGNPQPYEGLSGQTVRRGRHQVTYLPNRVLLVRLRSARVWRHKYDLLYVNSLFNRGYSILPLLLKRVGVLRSRAVLLAPRGELSAGALALHARRKRVAIILLRVLLRDRDLVWHASTSLEATDIRREFPHARIVVSADPVDLPQEALPPVVHEDGPVRVVFISRISAMKNLDTAIRGLALCSGAISFEIFGPIEDRPYWERCLDLIDTLPAHVTARYLGALDPGSVLQTFQAADAFLFPTKGENFGHVIAESLAASCPVICTANTPWTSQLRAGGGWIVTDEESIAHVLDELSELSPTQRLAARQRVGGVYAEWRDGLQGAHVFDMV